MSLRHCYADKSLELRCLSFSGNLHLPTATIAVAMATGFLGHPFASCRTTVTQVVNALTGIQFISIPLLTDRHAKLKGGWGFLRLLYWKHHPDVWRNGYGAL
jgi:hypothetical protein